MKRSIIALAAAAMVAAALPYSAQARCGGCGFAAGPIGKISRLWVPLSRRRTDKQSYLRMASSTAAVGQQSIFSPLRF